MLWERKTKQQEFMLCAIFAALIQSILSSLNFFHIHSMTNTSSFYVVLSRRFLGTFFRASFLRCSRVHFIRMLMLSLSVLSGFLFYHFFLLYSSLSFSLDFNLATHAQKHRLFFAPNWKTNSSALKKCPGQCTLFTFYFQMNCQQKKTTAESEKKHKTSFSYFHFLSRFYDFLFFHLLQRLTWTFSRHENTSCCRWAFNLLSMIFVNEIKNASDKSKFYYVLF